MDVAQEFPGLPAFWDPLSLQLRGLVAHSGGVLHGTTRTLQRDGEGGERPWDARMVRRVRLTGRSPHFPAPGLAEASASNQPWGMGAPSPFVGTQISTRAAGRVPSRGGPMAPSGCAGSGVCDRRAGHGPAASNELEERVGKQPWGKPNQHDGPAQEQRAHVARPSLGRLVHQGAHEQQTPSQPDHQHEGGPPWHPLGAGHPKSQHEQRQESQNREAGCGDDIIHCVTLSQPQQRGKPPPAPGNDSRRWTRHGMAMSALASRAGAGGRTLPRDGGPGHGARRALPCLDTLGPVVVRGRLGGPRRATVDVGRARPAGASP